MPRFQLDFFRKLPEDLQIRSRTGVFFTAVAFCAMGLLLVSNYRAFFDDSTRMFVSLDSHQEDRLRINFNVSLLAIPCRHASVDLSDFMGQRFVNITRHIRRFRLASDDDTGEVKRLDEVIMDDHAPVWGGIDHRNQQNGVHYSTPLTTATFDEFLSKYELVLVNYYAPWCPFCQRLNPEWETAAAQLDDHPEYSERVRMASVDCTDPDAAWLCRRAMIRAYPSMMIYMYGSTFTRYIYNGPRTAAHLLEFLDLFYRRLEPEADFAEEVKIEKNTLALPMPVNEQNMDSVDMKKVKRTGATDITEGCEVSGSISVNRVPGKLIFTARAKDHSINRMDINVTHRIDHFSFGQLKLNEHLIDGSIEHEDSSRYLLDHMRFEADDVNITVEHFLNVVGWDHEDMRQSSFEPTRRVYEFTASSNQYNASNSQPAALFTYDVSPLVVRVVKHAVPLYHLFTHMCAVIGGIFTLIGLLDAGVFYTLNSIQKKKQLGKFI